MESLDDLSDVMALTNGAGFVRGDLHIHSNVGSHDVADPTATPEEIVATAIREGLSIVAIADHNEIDAVERAILAATGKDLLVVPAIELSTMQGHLLCYLPSLDALRRFHAQLKLNDRGLSNSRCENGMTDCLNKVQELGGFGVLAHVDAPKGLDTEMPGANPHKSDIISHPALLGIELKNASSTITFTEADPDAARATLGRERVQRHGGTSSPLSRILNSDAHTITALGRNAAGDNRVTRYKVQALSFGSLKHALTDGDARVRIEDELPKKVPVLKAMRLSGGFLKDQAIHFSPNLNCIIGGRGTGKSTTFEAIRAFSPHPGNNPVVGSDVWPERIDIAFIDQVGQSHQLIRSKSDLSPTNIFDPLEGLELIPVECYGQGETQKISQKAQDDPGALLSYLDRFTDVSSELKSEENARLSIYDLQSKIADARTKVDLIPQYKRDLSIKQQQIRKLDEGEAKKIIELSRQLQLERQTRGQIVIDAKQVNESLDYAAVRKALASLQSVPNPAALVVGEAEYTAIAASAKAFEDDLKSSETLLKSKSGALNTAISAKVREWAEKEKTLLADIEQRKAALEAQGLQVDTAYINKLTVDEASLVNSIKNLTTWVPHLSDLEKQLAKLVADRWRARTTVSVKRTGFATRATAKLRAALTDLNVTLKFEADAYSPQGHDLLVEVMGWRTTQVQRATLVTQTLTVPRLLSAIAANDPSPIAALRTADNVAVFSRPEAQNLIDRFKEPANLARLQTVPVFDRPKLTVSRPSTDAQGVSRFLVREFGQLSLGQQQSVLLALMLSSDSPNPLLIDQPEDNLDSEFIYSQLVPVIRQAKEKRQIIIVTHNPNIAVLGDAEQIIVLKANNERSTIVSRGSIDDPQTKEAACAILEGARLAFTRRGRVYGL